MFFQLHYSAHNATATMTTTYFYDVLGGYTGGEREKEYKMYEVPVEERIKREKEMAEAGYPLDYGMDP